MCCEVKMLTGWCNNNTYNLVIVNVAPTILSTVLQNSSAAENILLAVDTVSQTLKESLRVLGEKSTSIIKPNITIEVSNLRANDILYPKAQQGYNISSSENWIYNTSSEVFLPGVTLGSKYYTYIGHLTIIKNY